jgi:hypothetical protein
MANPQAAQTSSDLTHILVAHGPYIIAGAVALIGAVILILHRMGILIFNRETRERLASGVCQHCSLTNGNGGNSNKNGQPPIVRCESHDELCGMVKKSYTEQKVLAVEVKTQAAALAEGKLEFKKLNDRIADLRVGVAVLLERSGGTPPEFRKGAVDKTS